MDLKISDPADIDRRLANSADIYSFLSCYFPDVFWGDWTEQRRQMVAAILNAASYGGDQAIPPVQDSRRVPTLPGLQFFEHSNMLLGILAVNLDLPLCVFLLDASETSYSGFRGAIDQARQRWREIQSWMMGSFHRPVYEWKVRQWAVTDSALRKAVERADELRASLVAAARWCRHALRRRPRLTASNGWKAAVRSVGNGISRIRIPWCGILSLPEETVHFQAVPHGATEADACSQIGLRFR